MRKYLNKLNKLQYHHIFFLLLLFGALFLRTYRLEKSVWLQSGYDESRDMLIASHILHNSEFVSNGPLAAGANGWLNNSPVYYYFVSFIYFFSEDPVIFMYLWAVMMLLPVILGYLIGKTIYDTKTGLLIAATFAINYRILLTSRELLQPNLLPIFSLAFIYSIVLFYRKKNNRLKYLLLAIFSLVAPLHLHYGILLSLPFGIILIIYSWCDLNKKEENLKEVLIPIIFFVLLILSWILLTYREFPLDQLIFFTKSVSLKVESSIYSRFIHMSSLFTEMVGIFKYTIYFSILISFLYVLREKIVFFKKVLKHHKELLAILFMIFSSLLLIFYKIYVAESYLLYLFPFILILLSLILRFVLLKNRYLGILFISLFFVNGIVTTNNSVFKNLPQVSYHDTQKAIAYKIAEHYQSLENHRDEDLPELLLTWYTTSRNMPYDGWGTSGVWFYLEKIFNLDLVVNTNYGLNHTPINKYPTIIYMICDDRLHLNLVETECIEPFKKAYNITTINKLTDFGELTVWFSTINKNKTMINNQVQTKGF